MEIKDYIRLQKFMANCGLGSRRFCETLITAGRVRVNGIEIKELGTKINPLLDEIECNGKKLYQEPLITFLLNKPQKVICSSNDPKKRKTVINFFDDLPERVYTIGRLDYMSEGLILVTNDGKLAHSVMHPKFEITKIYNVWLDKKLENNEINQSKIGIFNEGDILKINSINFISKSINGFKYSIKLTEGKNRHIRRMMEVLNKKVLRLQRFSIGPIDLGNLKIGEYRRAKPSELKILRSLIK
ncbi:MAG: pseudouridine synthase [Pontiellaceae bacterium]